MEQLAPVLDVVTTCLSLFSIVVLIWGVVVSAKDFFVYQYRTRRRESEPYELTETKNVLGRYILFSLEILIASDIVASIINPSLEDIIRLAAIVAIRTVISYFLNKEIKGAEDEKK